MAATPDTSLRERLRTALATALKAGDSPAVSALRSALSAIENAESVGQRIRPAADGLIAGSVAGLGAGDVPRRVLSEEEITVIVRTAILELRSAAEQYERLGETEAAARARSEADVLVSQMPPSGS